MTEEEDLFHFDISEFMNTKSKLTTHEKSNEERKDSDKITKDEKQDKHDKESNNKNVIPNKESFIDDEEIEQELGLDS